MKNIVKNIIAIALVAASLSSCIKEVFPESSTATAEQVGASASALDAAMSGIPAQMTQGYLIYGSQTYETDMAYPSFMIALAEITGDMYAVADAGYDHYQNYNTCKNFAPDNGRNVYVPWRTLYMFVKSANDVIGAVDEDSASESLLAYAGMAYCYRALDYWMLMNFYEFTENQYTKPESESVIKDRLTVPIVTNETPSDQIKNNPRATHADMVAFILSDLDKAEKYLANYTPSSKLYPSLAVAYGLKARVYMSDAQYSKAAEYARKAIDAAGCTPLSQSQWEDPTTGFNTINAAWMWASTYSAENMGNLCNFIGWMSPESDWGYASLTGPGIDKGLYDKIPDSDFRKHTWLDPNKRNYYAYQSVRGNEWIDDAPDYTSLKFRCVSGDYETYSVGGVCDIPLMRIEEMYYIEAEAKGLVNLEDGKTALNSFVQTYRNPDFTSKATTADDFESEILLQKKIEFWGEGISFFDAKRMKAGCTQSYDGTNAPGNNFKLNCVGIKPNWNFVIPTTEVQNNKALEGLNNPDPSNTVTPDLTH